MSTLTLYSNTMIHFWYVTILMSIMFAALRCFKIYTLHVFGYTCVYIMSTLTLLTYTMHFLSKSNFFQNKFALPCVCPNSIHLLCVFLTKSNFKIEIFFALPCVCPNSIHYAISQTTLLSVFCTMLILHACVMLTVTDFL